MFHVTRRRTNVASRDTYPSTSIHTRAIQLSCVYRRHVETPSTSEVGSPPCTFDFLKIQGRGPSTPHAPSTWDDEGIKQPFRRRVKVSGPSSQQSERRALRPYSTLPHVASSSSSSRSNKTLMQHGLHLTLQFASHSEKSVITTAYIVEIKIWAYHCYLICHRHPIAHLGVLLTPAPRFAIDATAHSDVSALESWGPPANLKTPALHGPPCRSPSGVR